MMAPVVLQLLFDKMIVNSHTHTQYGKLKISYYALPAIPLAALSLPLYVIVPAFYTEQLGLSLSVVGMTLLFVRLFDAVSDPCIGWLSDSLHLKLGRRRSLFLASLPITAIAALMVFWPPLNANAVYLAFWVGVLSVGNTGASLSYAAWGAELSADYKERARISGFREVATIIGILLAISLPFAVGINASENMNGLAALGLFIFIALPLTGVLAVYKVPEPGNHSRSKLGLRAGLLALNANPPFKRLLIAFLFNGLANAIPATLFLYFVSARIGNEAARGPLLFLYFLCGIVGIPIALWFSAHYGKHRSWCIAMIIACTAFCFAGFLSSGDIIEFIVICVITGLLLGFDLALPPAIQADVIDYDTAKTGDQRTGMYFAFWSLTTKLSLALAVIITFPLLDYSGFIPDLSNNNSNYSLSILAGIYGWVPIVPKIAAIALMWNFPIDQKVQIILREQIEHKENLFSTKHIR